MPSFHYNQITGVTTPAGTLSLNTTSGDRIVLDPGACSGLGVSKLRVPIFDKGQTHGYIILPSFEEGQHLVLSGYLIIDSSTTEAGMLAARNTALADARTKLKSILSPASGTLTFATGGGDDLTVYCEMLPTATDYTVKRVVFGLVSASAV